MGLNESTFESFLNAIREAVVVVDPTLRIVAANQSARETFHRNNVELVGSRLSEVFRDFAVHDALRLAVVEGSPADVKVEFGFPSKNTFELHAAPVVHNGSRHGVGFFRDVTQVERLEKVRQEFLSNISHELRTPLTSIMAFVETLEDGAIDEPEDNRRFLAVIRRNAERMNRLIADIAELSMIESGNVTIENMPVRISNTVDEIFASLSAKAAERSIELVNAVSKEERVTADPSRIEQMLTNLVDNAIKFNVSGGVVRVSVDNTPDRAVINVSDTGEGILPEQLGRIFERFYRVDRGRTREIGGTGLGLSIVKHLARLHGGDVSVTSNLGEGTVFAIMLPPGTGLNPRDHAV